MRNKLNYSGVYLKTEKELVGEKIRMRREAMGFATQGDLANAVDTDQTRVSRWETGESEPKGRLRVALKKALLIDENFFKPDPQAPSALDIAFGGEILTKLSKMNPNHRAVCLSLIFEDASYMDKVEQGPAMAAVAALLKAR